MPDLQNFDGIWLGRHQLLVCRQCRALVRNDDDAGKHQQWHLSVSTKTKVEGTSDTDPHVNCDAIINKIKKENEFLYQKNQEFQKKIERLRQIIENN